MGMFRINIRASGGHGCERSAKPGDKLYKRCGRFTCADCIAFDLMQQLRQKGFTVVEAEFTHYDGAVDGTTVVDDMVKNERKIGQF